MGGGSREKEVLGSPGLLTRHIGMVVRGGGLMTYLVHRHVVSTYCVPGPRERKGFFQEDLTFQRQIDLREQ